MTKTIDIQDEVALKLSSCPIEEEDMHELMAEYGSALSRLDGWSVIIRRQETHEFLLSHGWSLKEYIHACARLANHNRHTYIGRVMCPAFVRAYPVYA